MFEENIKQLGIEIPDMPSPLANYVPYKVSDSVVYVSGQGPVKNGELVFKGKVGEDITIDDGIKAAELCCINIVAALKKSINGCLLYTSPSPRDTERSRMPSSA